MMKFLFLLLFTVPVFAHTPTFGIMVKREKDKSWFLVKNEGKKWICQTQHFPHYEAKSNPLAKMNWKALEAESKNKPKGCKDKVAISNKLEKRARKISTCLSQKETSALYLNLTNLCRSKI